MWWNGPGWEHMYGGWWLMPVFGLLCMLIFLIVISKIFGSGFCQRSSPRPEDREDIDSLKNEIRQLRQELRTLRSSIRDDRKKDAPS